MCDGCAVASRFGIVGVLWSTGAGDSQVFGAVQQQQAGTSSLQQPVFLLEPPLVPGCLLI